MDSLSPCPFCGESPSIGKHDEWRDFEHGQFLPYVVFCKCGAMLDDNFHSELDAQKAWNNRPFFSNVKCCVNCSDDKVSLKDVAKTVSDAIKSAQRARGMV